MNGDPYNLDRVPKAPAPDAKYTPRPDDVVELDTDDHVQQVTLPDKLEARA